MLNPDADITLNQIHEDIKKEYLVDFRRVMDALSYFRKSYIHAWEVRVAGVRLDTHQPDVSELDRVKRILEEF